MKLQATKLNLRDAMHVKSAELWLQVGETTQALDELQRLSSKALVHPWAMAVFTRAFQCARAFC